MEEASLVEILKKNGWEVHSEKTLLSYCKKDLIDYIRCLEHNYACALERLDRQANFLQELNQKMRCCENCKHQNRLAGESKWWEHCAHCKAYSEWEAREEVAFIESLEFFSNLAGNE